MQLRAFLKLKKITQVEFAKSLGVDPMTVYRWVRGRQPPSWQNAKEIVAHCEGYVTYNDLYGGNDEAVKLRPKTRSKSVGRGEVSG